MYSKEPPTKINHSFASKTGKGYADCRGPPP